MSDESPGAKMRRLTAKDNYIIPFDDSEINQPLYAQCNRCHLFVLIAEYKYCPACGWEIGKGK